MAYRKTKILEDEMVDRYNCEYCNIIGENDMCEAKEGEWVRYDDIKHILQNTPSNSDYAKCPCCDEPWNIREHDSCSCGAFISKRS